MAKTLGIVILGMFLTCQINCQEAILHVSNSLTYREYCIVYNASWTNLSSSLSSSVEYELVNLTSTALCSRSGFSPGQLKGKAVAVQRGECDFGQKALVAQDLGAKVILVASNTSLIIPSTNETKYGKVQIPLALMRFRDFVDAEKALTNMSVRLFAPPVPVFDASILAMLLISVTTVALGGLWSGACEREKLSNGPSAGGAEEKVGSGDLSLYSPLKVVIFVALMCVMLVLMYFFYTWLVYVIIVIFCIASATALYSCVDAVMDLMGCGTLYTFPCLNKALSVRSLLLGAVCITAAVLWGVYRNEDRWIWILQDLLGVAFCLNFMKTITLSNFKICVILLSLLLLYDVFFVFITPFFTQNGESIMVQVALGPGGAGEKSGGNTLEVPAEPPPPFEKLPVVMRVPRFSALAQNLCGMQFSILGYGDIIVPGLLVAYCHRFDVWTSSSKKIYFVSCTIAYLVGMVITFAVMILSKMGQPALLYLVPFTLLTSAVVAWQRKEMRQFWAGTTYEVLDSSREPLLQDGAAASENEGRKC